MLFNSLIFLVFGAVFFAIWPWVKKFQKSKLITLIIASFIFYGWWDWRFLFLIIFSGCIDFIAGLKMAQQPTRKKFYLILSILGNIGSLAIFKYSGFIAENFDFVLEAIGVSMRIQDNIPDFALILPVGISFYTFQSMSYTIDIYKGKLEPTKNIYLFFAYLSMFPQLVAGPIIRARDLIPQLQQYRPVNEVQRWHGLKLIIIGFFKKVVLADNLGTMVNWAFRDEVPYESTSYWWIIAIAFSLQIYYDFSGYTDIARGLAKWMGFHFKMNFNHPYISISIREFWQRWHISLSTWFRDYVYIPLGGSQKGKLYAHIFMWITMLISGLWHGAAWTFIIWGAIHAFFVTIERLTKWPKYVHKYFIGKIFSWVFVFVQVVIAYVFFRAISFDQGWEITKVMFDFNTIHYEFKDINQLIFFGLAIIFEIILVVNTKFIPVHNNRTRTFFEILIYAVLIVMIIFFRGPEAEFIYFQF
jgi:alginate O-acetyltransferase complex protein AlgI